MPKRFNAGKEAPELLQALGALSQKADGLGLEAQLLHLVKLRASQINGCAYCISLHAREALRDGEKNERLLLLNAWRESTEFNPRERAALAWTEEVTLINERHVPDSTFLQAQEHFPGRSLADLTMSIIAVNAWNRFAISLR